ncbi:hypothetical protein ACEQ8H_008946 [Pleosporales sp. CAS-2024a]
MSKIHSLQARQQKASPPGSQFCLNSDVIQTASNFTGQEPGTQGIKPGQSPSNVDQANFINFCEGQVLTNGSQIKSGSCNGIPMGRLPAQTNMVSAVIVSPKFGDRIPSNTTFNITVQTSHLDAGFFTNPTVSYYSAPQNLNKNGDVIGHCHITIQDIGSFGTTTPPDPATFAFFKGIDNAGNGTGFLTAVVSGGLPQGFYRACTINSAANHQPVAMPVAQRGAQDDCSQFEVFASSTGNATTVNAKNGDGNQNQATEGIVKNKGATGSGASGTGDNGTVDCNTDGTGNGGSGSTGNGNTGNGGNGNTGNGNTGNGGNGNTGNDNTGNGSFAKNKSGNTDTGDCDTDGTGNGNTGNAGTGKGRGKRFSSRHVI